MAVALALVLYLLFGDWKLAAAQMPLDDAILLPPTPDGYVIREEARVQWLYPPELDDLSRKLANRLPKLEESLDKDWGLELPDRFVVYLAKDSSALARVFGKNLPDWYAGFAIAERRWLILNADKSRQRGEGALFSIFLHELAHLAIGYGGTGKTLDVPRWFDEGLAMNVAGIWDLAEVWQMESTRPPGKLFSLANLDAGFPPQQADMRRAYWQSYHAVGEFLKIYGQGGIKTLYRKLREGQSFGIAFHQVTGKHLLEWDEAYRSAMDSWLRSILVFTSGTMFWGIMGALALLAVWLNHLRRRRKQELLELEDAWEDAKTGIGSDRIH